MACCRRGPDEYAGAIHADSVQENICEETDVCRSLPEAIGSLFSVPEEYKEEAISQIPEGSDKNATLTFGPDEHGVIYELVLSMKDPCCLFNLCVPSRCRVVVRATKVETTELTLRSTVERIQSIISAKQDFGAPRFTKRGNTNAGKLAHGLMSHEKLDIYTVMMPAALHILPKQHYFKGIDKTKQLWESGAKSKIIQAAILTEHAVLYRARVCRCRSTVTKGQIADGEDLLKLLNYGRDAQEQPAFFTYVIDLNGRWCFSRTGSATSADLLSKHVVHNKARPELLYAGEFHVKRDGNECDGYDYTLVLDNNSGTYAPDSAQLPRLAALFREVFPGLKTDAWDAHPDHFDPRLTAAIQRAPTRAVKEEPKEEKQEGEKDETADIEAKAPGVSPEANKTAHGDSSVSSVTGNSSFI